MNITSTLPILTALASFVLVQPSQLPAQDSTPALEFIQTKVVDGVFAAITDDLGSTNTPLDRQLCFCLRTVTNGLQRVAFPSEPEYAYQIELFDTNGIAQPKTALGKRAGTKFLDFDARAFDRAIKIQHTFARGKDKPPALLILFRPSDLFAIERPGRYTLRISLQVLSISKPSPDRRHAPPRLIRFPAIDYPLRVPAPIPHPST
jgi:hypothetical protein